MHILKISVIIYLIFAEGFLPATHQGTKIAVIGAGLAGLTTAYHLKTKGFDVDLFEARARIGGRIFTAVVDDMIVELGGQNIADGGSAEHIRSLVDQLGLELTHSTRDLNLYYFDGSSFIEEQQLLRKFKLTPESLAIHLAAIAQKSTTMRDVLRELFSEDDPLFNIYNVKLAAYEGGPTDTLSPRYISTLYHMLLGGISVAHASTPDKKVTIITIKGGNALLVHKLAEVLEGQIHVNMPLQSVSKNAHGSYTLTFPHTTVVADILVLALPSSVYKDIHIDDDVIPPGKRSALENIAYGTNAKIILPFSAASLEKKQFLNDRLIIFPNVNNTNVNLYYTGQAGCFSAETVRATYERDLRFLQKSIELPSSLQPPILAPDESFTCLTGPVTHNWCTDQYAQGSYSYIAPGQETLLTALQKTHATKVKALFAPIDDTLYFAGEHTTILDDVRGTMEAACESGVRTAYLIEQSRS